MSILGGHDSAVRYSHPRAKHMKYILERENTLDLHKKKTVSAFQIFWLRSNTHHSCLQIIGQNYSHVHPHYKRARKYVPNKESSGNICLKVLITFSLLKSNVSIIKI